jgi:hypothetical protein
LLLKATKQNESRSVFPGLPDGICVFIPKIQIWSIFGGPWNEKSWYILLSFGIYYGIFGNLMAMWYIFPRFGIFNKRKIMWYIFPRFGVFN